MKLKAPLFWNKPRLGPSAVFLTPFSAITRLAGWKRQQKRSVRLPVPVLCCGSITTGGTGKTPLTLDLARRLQARGYQPHILTRGYGGRHRQHGRVCPRHNSPFDVGDEAILLARQAPTWSGANRLLNARRAIAAGADCLLLDDGLQDASLEKDFSILTIDGGVGLGNGLLLPAGPLRESLSSLLKRTQQLVIFGPDKHRLATRLSSWAGRIDHATVALRPETLRLLADKRLIAFAGIGRPQKFFDMLQDSGLQLLRGLAFPDHHIYAPRTLRHLAQMATSTNIVLVTTEKDATKLPSVFRQNVQIITPELLWRTSQAPEHLLDRFLAQAQTNQKPITPTAAPPTPC